MTDAECDPHRTGQTALRLFEGADVAVIVAPFITKRGITPLLEAVGAHAPITVFTRWRADEVAAGVSDPNVYDLVADRGGDVRLHHALHAKAYVYPGMAALVGSSNVTATALGWSGPGGVELLVRVAADEPAVVALLKLLEATASEATSQIRDQVLAHAELFDSSQRLKGVDEDATPALSAWLPTYSAPWALWHVYTGDREEEVARLAQPELEALDVPPALTEEQFNAYVGSALLQGLPGLAAQQLSNRSAYQAVRALAKLCEDVGLEVEDPERQWNTLASWIAHFLPDSYKHAIGGPALHR